MTTRLEEIRVRSNGHVQEYSPTCQTCQIRWLLARLDAVRALLQNPNTTEPCLGLPGCYLVSDRWHHTERCQELLAALDTAPPNDERGSHAMSDTIELSWWNHPKHHMGAPISAREVDAYIESLRREIQQLRATCLKTWACAEVREHCPQCGCSSPDARMLTEEERAKVIFWRVLVEGCPRDATCLSQEVCDRTAEMLAIIDRLTGVTR